jgi:hypothetical protein
MFILLIAALPTVQHSECQNSNAFVGSSPGIWPNFSLEWQIRQLGWLTTLHVSP